MIYLVQRKQDFLYIDLYITCQTKQDNKLIKKVRTAQRPNTDKAESMTADTLALTGAE